MLADQVQVFLRPLLKLRHHKIFAERDERRFHTMRECLPVFFLYHEHGRAKIRSLFLYPLDSHALKRERRGRILHRRHQRGISGHKYDAAVFGERVQNLCLLIVQHLRVTEDGKFLSGKLVRAF